MHTVTYALLESPTCVSSSGAEASVWCRWHAREGAALRLIVPDHAGLQCAFLLVVVGDDADGFSTGERTGTLGDEIVVELVAAGLRFHLREVVEACHAQNALLEVGDRFLLVIVVRFFGDAVVRADECQQDDCQPDEKKRAVVIGRHGSSLGKRVDGLALMIDRLAIPGTNHACQLGLIHLSLLCKIASEWELWLNLTNDIHYSISV